MDLTTLMKNSCKAYFFFTLSIFSIDLAKAQDAPVFTPLTETTPTYIQIQSDSIKPIIGIQKIGGDLGVHAQKILEFDLSINNKLGVKILKSTDSSEAIQERALTAISGSVSTNENNIDIQLFAKDQLTGMVLAQKIISVPKSPTDSWRKIVHQLSDEMTKLNLGDFGIATTQIAWTTRTKSSREVVIADYDGARLQTITHDNSIAMLPDWSKDNQSIYYTSFKDDYASLWKIDIQTKHLERISPVGLQVFGGRVSPEGKFILYTQQNEDASDIYKLNLETKKRERLTFHSASETSPDWAPNSYSFAYTSNRGGSPQIYTMDVDGGNETRISKSGGYVESPTWSPSGDKIVYCQMDGNVLNLYIMDSDGSKVTQLTQNQGSNENPTWSPDGNLIAFSSTRSGTSQIYIMRPDGTGVQQISKSGINTSPRWSRRTTQP